MEVSATARELRLVPGAAGELELEVLNTADVIDAVEVRAVGLPEGSVRTDPAVLSLFPEATGRMTVAVCLPDDFPAGRHPVVLEVRGEAAGASRDLDVALDVACRAELSVEAAPPMVRARRRATFHLRVRNHGNVALEVGFGCGDVAPGLRARISPAMVTVAGGASATTRVTVRGPRHLLGSDRDGAVQVRATAHLAPVPGPGTDPESCPGQGDLESVTALTLRQRPMISAGVLTAATLGLVVLGWATAFFFGFTRVLADKPPTMEAPASFFLSGPRIERVSDPPVTAENLPPGTVLKDGPLPEGMGVTVTGTVIARSDREPVGAVVVRAYHRSLLGKSPPLVRPGAPGTPPDGIGASDALGRFTISGLFPGRYLFVADGQGLRPDAPRPEAVLQDTGPTSLGFLVVEGLPGSLTVTVDYGTVGDLPETRATALRTRRLGATDGAAAPGPSPATSPGPSPGPSPGTSAPQGRREAVPTPVPLLLRTSDSGRRVNRGPARTEILSVSNLPAPARYQFTVSADGYSTVTRSVVVDAGQRLHAPTIRLTAPLGMITGTVTGNGTPLGNAHITTTVAGETEAGSPEPRTADTATQGSGTGRFALGKIPTPGTYTLTVAAEGYRDATRVVTLGPGRAEDVGPIPLTPDRFTVTGRITKSLDGTTCDTSPTSARAGRTSTGGSGVAAAGAVIDLLDDPGRNVPAGADGRFTVNGVPARTPHRLRIRLPGYQDEVILVRPPASGTSLRVTTTPLRPATGALLVTVNGVAGAAAPGVAVTVTDGVTVSPERTTDVRGRYCWTGLKGDTWYTATARTPEGLFAAAGRRIAAGTAAEARLTLTKR